MPLHVAKIPKLVHRTKKRFRFRQLFVQKLELRKSYRDGMDPIQILYSRYQTIMQKLPYSSLLRETKYKLLGLQQCIEYGPNEEKYPDYKHHVKHRYYEWCEWRKHTLQLQQLMWVKNREFVELAMLAYIKHVHEYLHLLNLL